MVRLLLSLIFLFSVSGTPSFAREKPTIDGAALKIKQHRSRLPRHGLLILFGRPAFFPTLHSLTQVQANRLVNVYLGMLHDIVKDMPLEDLRKWGYEGEKDFLTQLHEIWGKSIRPPFIDVMNTVEDQIKKEVMADELSKIDPRMHKKIMAELILLEVTSDIFDTKHFRGAELNFGRVPFAAEQFLEARGMAVAAKLARWYEGKYYLKPGAAMSCQAIYR